MVSVGLTGWLASATRVATPANCSNLQTLSLTLLISQQEEESRVGDSDHIDAFRCLN